MERSTSFSIVDLVRNFDITINKKVDVYKCRFAYDVTLTAKCGIERVGFSEGDTHEVKFFKVGELDYILALKKLNLTDAELISLDAAVGAFGEYYSDERVFEATYNG
jgi:hypothetical protein